MRRSTGALYLLAVMMVASACSGGDDDTAASSTARSSIAPAVTASISTVPSTTSASTPTVVVATTTTTTAAPTTTTGAPAPTTTLPSCTDQPNAGTCTLPTAPLPPDVDSILARYREFAAKYLEVASNPDNPDWEGLLAYVRSDVRAEARAEIENRFKRGEVLNVSLGVTFNPIFDRNRYPDGQAFLVDCRTDGSYWADRATGTPVDGELAEVRQRPVRVGLSRVGGVWVLVQFEYATGRCG